MLAIIAYMKNECHILREWIQHHLDSGADFIYLLDNGSNDNFLDIVNCFTKNVELCDYKKLGQFDSINKKYKQIKDKYEWVSVIDLDEFLYHEKYEFIPHCLEQISDDVGCIKINWKVFLIDDFFQPLSVIESNLTRIKNDDSAEQKGKYILRTLASKHTITIHYPNILPKYKTLTFSPDDGEFQINHYRFQSFEFYIGIKQLRGGGVNKNRYKSLHILNDLYAQPKTKDTVLLTRSARLIDELKKIINIGQKSIYIIICCGIILRIFTR